MFEVLLEGFIESRQSLRIGSIALGDESHQIQPILLELGIAVASHRDQAACIVHSALTEICRAAEQSDASVFIEIVGRYCNVLLPLELVHVLFAVEAKFLGAMMASPASSKHSGRTKV
jgi:hypothetical protein